MPFECAHPISVRVSNATITDPVTEMEVAYRISANSFPKGQIQKRIVSAETICGITVYHGALYACLKSPTHTLKLLLYVQVLGSVRQYIYVLLNWHKYQYI